jgi:hypothetical protein
MEDNHWLNQMLARYLKPDVPYKRGALPGGSIGAVKPNIRQPLTRSLSVPNSVANKMTFTYADD